MTFCLSNDIKLVILKRKSRCNTELGLRANLLGAAIGQCQRNQKGAAATKRHIRYHRTSHVSFCHLKMDLLEIVKMSDFYIIITKLSERQKILDEYADLPRCLRKKIVNFVASVLPEVRCVECKGMFYPHELSSFECVCKPCAHYYAMGMWCP